MQNPKTFYQNRKDQYESLLLKYKKQLALSSSIRLIVFLMAAAGVYFFWQNYQVVVAVVVVFLVLFLILVSRHSNLQYKRDYAKKVIALNLVELKVLNRDFQDLPSGESYSNPNHFYSQDIDLFGKGSFFQYLNRTALESGQEVLANYLVSNGIDNIPQKQKGIKELAQKSAWRQDFLATASLTEPDLKVPEILNWLKNYKPFVPRFMGVLPYVFSAASLALMVLSYFDLIGFNAVVFWFFLGLFIVGMYFKKVTHLSEFSGKMQSTFEQYYKLLLLIEDQVFDAQILSREANKIHVNQKEKASAVIKSFSRMLSALDQRNNMLVGVLINGFLLADLFNAYRIERWVNQHAAQVAQWFEAIAFFDAQISLGNFAYNHPEYSFAAIKKEAPMIQATHLAHPLLDPQKAVANDFSIDNEQFYIITGANMAGKSTFLRTLSLCIVMSNVGLPVCAKQASYTPIKLITSMRTSDSLTDDESYFFSELKRLQFIVQAIKTDNYFIILDEILKGTNSIDKAKGSKKFIKRLVASQSTGIIATHDLSLCETADELEDVHNYYFDAQIKEGELFFDYTFKPGICQNMNASFLLKKMGIV